MWGPQCTALINRNTNETKVQVSLSLDGGSLDLLPVDFAAESMAPNAPIPAQTTNHHASQLKGSQQIWIWTGIGFLDHMLHAWSKHAGWSLRVRCRGDLASTSSLFLFSASSFKAHPRLQLTITTEPETPSSRSGPPSPAPSDPVPVSPASAIATRPSTKRSPAPSSIYRPALSSSAIFHFTGINVIRKKRLLDRL